MLRGCPEVHVAAEDVCDCTERTFKGEQNLTDAEVKALYDAATGKDRRRYERELKARAYKNK